MLHYFVEKEDMEYFTKLLHLPICLLIIHMKDTCWCILWELKSSLLCELQAQIKVNCVEGITV